MLLKWIYSIPKKINAIEREQGSKMNTHKKKRKQNGNGMKDWLVTLELNN